MPVALKEPKHETTWKLVASSIMFRKEKERPVISLQKKTSMSKWLLKMHLEGSLTGLGLRRLMLFPTGIICKQVTS